MTQRSRLSVVARLAVCFAAASALLPAQGVARFLPANPIFEMSVLGPRALGERMADTNIGRLLADPAAAPIRDMPGKLLDTLLEEIGDPRAETHVRGAYEFLRDYGGRMSVAVRVVADEKAEDAIAELLIGFVLEPDGTTDFASVVDMVRRAANDAEMEQRTIGSEENGFTIARGENRAELALPRVVDGHLVSYFGFDLDNALARLGEGAPAEGEAAVVDESLLKFRVDVGQIWPIVAAGASQTRDADPEVIEVIGKYLGLGRMEATYGVDREFVRADFALVATGARSILDMFQPTAKTTPLASLAPADHENWTSVRVDLNDVFSLVRDVAMDIRGEDLFDVVEQMSTAFGVDIRRDVLGALDGQLLLLNDSMAALAAMEAGEEDEDVELAGMYSGVVGLRDAKSFDATLEKLLRSRGLHAARKTTEYRGIPIRTMNVAIVQISYAIVNEGIAFGVGPIGMDSVRAIVDASLAATDGQSQIRFPERFAERRGRIGDGWRDFQISSSAGYAGLLRDAMVEELATLGDPDMESVFTMHVMPALEAWLELAPRFDLERNFGAMRVVPGRLEAVSIQ